jgi:hypothetical protein
MVKALRDRTTLASVCVNGSHRAVPALANYLLLRAASRFGLENERRGLGVLRSQPDAGLYLS